MRNDLTRTKDHPQSIVFWKHALIHFVQLQDGIAGIIRDQILESEQTSLSSKGDR